MKSLLLIAVCTLLCANAASALPGGIYVFSDGAFASCHFIDAGGLVYVYFVHMFTDGATAVQFKLDAPNGWNLLGHTSPFQSVIGDPISGVKIYYGECMNEGFLVLTAVFLGSSVPTCTSISVVPDPNAPSGKIEGFDCAQTKIFPGGGSGVVNPDGSCQCVSPIPVQETTWGQVKALYQ